MHSFNRFQKEFCLYVSLWENDPHSNLIYILSTQFPNEFMISVTSFMSSPIQHAAHFHR